jgi:hypothetical protein
MSFNSSISTIATQASVWLLTAAAMLATTEMLHTQEHAAVPITTGTGHVAQVAPEAITARAEGAKESARTPEEYDIGLRMPAITGT